MKRYKYRKTFTFDGKRYNAYGDTEKEALQRMIQKKADLESGKVTVSGSMTVNQWAEVAFDTYKTNIQPAALKDMKTRFWTYTAPVMGNMKLTAVKPVQCQAVVNSVSGMSWSQCDKVIQELRFLFKSALQNNLINSNPAEFIVRPKITRGKRASISEEERAAFLEVYAKKEERFRLFALMYYCGCRPGEAMICRGSDLTLSDGVVMLHIRGTKTVNADRYVPMPTVLYDKVKAVLPDAPLAPKCDGGFHTYGSYVTLRKSFRYHMNIALGCRIHPQSRALIPPYPLRKSFCPYELRHTYCTDLARRGVDIRIAQKLMGHSSIAITADIYTHVDNERIVANAKQILGE